MKFRLRHQKDQSLTPDQLIADLAALHEEETRDYFELDGVRYFVPFSEFGWGSGVTPELPPANTPFVRIELPNGMQLAARYSSLTIDHPQIGPFFRIKEEDVVSLPLVIHAQRYEPNQKKVVSPRSTSTANQYPKIFTHYTFNQLPWFYSVADQT